MERFEWLELDRHPRVMKRVGNGLRVDTAAAGEPRHGYGVLNAHHIGLAYQFRRLEYISRYYEHIRITLVIILQCFSILSRNCIMLILDEIMGISLRGLMG